MPIIHAAASQIIRAPVEKVRALYLDYAHWPNLFPATIKRVDLIGTEGATKTLEITRAEGKVLNVVTERSLNEISLQEWKRRYSACFTNVFEPVPEGTRYWLAAEVTPKGLLRLLAPFARIFIRARMRRLVLEPMRRAAEGGTRYADASNAA